jgi:hypothetical protein
MDKFGMALPKTAPHRLVLTLFLALAVSSCTYVKYANLQAEYSRIQNAEPGQVNLKHMIDRETFFVYGRSVDPTGSYTRLPMAIAAYSSKFRANERVDIMYFTGTGTHYGLNLPEGRYDLLVFADSDGDGIFGRSEVVGQRQIELSKSSVPDKVLGQSDIRLTLPFTIGWVAPIDVPSGGGPKESTPHPSWNERPRCFMRWRKTWGTKSPSFLFMALAEAHAILRALSDNWIESDTNPGFSITHPVAIWISWPNCFIEYFSRARLCA